jgi:AAA+ ATPase superfamily predicted ATPase
MKFYNREDELQEMHLLRNTPPAMIVLTGRRRVGKTDAGTARSE